MTCSACVGSIEKALLEHPGVRTVQIALLTGTGTLTIDSALTDVESCAKVVDDMGFEAEPLTEIPLGHSTMSLLLSGPEGEGAAKFSETLRQVLEADDRIINFVWGNGSPAEILQLEYNMTLLPPRVCTERSSHFFN